MISVQTELNETTENIETIKKKLQCIFCFSFRIN